MAKSDELHDWCDLADAGWRSLFLGNGISINISSGFGYGKLYNRASLSPAAQRLFADYETTNFELVLERLGDTARVMRTFAFPIAQERNRARILHLHGGLHLWRDDRTGATGKWEDSTSRLYDRHSGVAA